MKMLVSEEKLLDWAFANWGHLQRNYLDEEQPVLCPTGRRRTLDRPRLSPKTELMGLSVMATSIDETEKAQNAKSLRSGRLKLLGLPDFSMCLWFRFSPQAAYQ